MPIGSDLSVGVKKKGCCKEERVLLKYLLPFFLSQPRDPERNRCSPQTQRNRYVHRMKPSCWCKEKGCCKEERESSVAKTHLLMPNGMQQVG